MRILSVIGALFLGGAFLTSSTDETRTAYGPLQDGYYPIYWRNADRVGIICPQTTPQWAEVEVSVSGATESEADLSDKIGRASCRERVCLYV